jgi:hypothetical protein
MIDQSLKRLCLPVSRATRKCERLLPFHCRISNRLICERPRGRVMAEDGVPEEWCEAVLNHKRPGLIGTYNLHRDDAEKRQALEHWSRRVEAIVTNSPGARVLPFAKFACPQGFAESGARR